MKDDTLDGMGAKEAGKNLKCIDVAGAVKEDDAKNQREAS